MSDWDHKDEWRMRGKDFLVTVTRHSETPSTADPYEGQNRWAVYAYIYDKHPLFSNFNGESISQYAVIGFPLHGGCSYVRSHMTEEGKKTSVQVGADYHHLHDDFTKCATKEDAPEVFEDAQQLFDFLTRKGATS